MLGKLSRRRRDGRRTDGKLRRRRLSDRLGQFVLIDAV
jgi:hypothetical protein